MSNVGGTRKLMRIWQLLTFSRSYSHALFQSLFFCVVKSSISYGIGLSLFPNQLVLRLPRHVVSQPVVAWWFSC